MDTIAEPIKRRHRKARLINRKKVIELASKGLSYADIAKHQDCAAQTIHKFVQRYHAEKAEVEEFKQYRADILSRMHGKALEVQERIIERFNDGMLEVMSPSQMSSVLFALNAVQGTIFDKERLERGESTQNISMLSRLLRSEVKTIYTKPLNSNNTAVIAQSETSVECATDEQILAPAQPESGEGRGTGGNPDAR